MAWNHRRILHGILVLAGGMGITGCGITYGSRETKGLVLEPAVESKEGPRLRTGARRDRAIEDAGYYVVHEPLKDLRFERLSSWAAGRELAFDVSPFKERPASAGDPGFEVERAGEIFSLALARQLQEMGWRVILRMTYHMAGVLGEEGWGPDPPTYARGVEVHGSVGLRIQFSAPERQVIASLTGEVEFQGVVNDVDSGEISLHPLRENLKQFDELETVACEKLEDAPGRGRQAARAVLARAVRKVLGGPDLERSLLAFIGSEVKVVP